MASLLDLFDGADDPRMMGLLGMMSGMSTANPHIPGRTPFGVALNQGLMAVAQGYGAAKKAKTEEELKRAELDLKKMLYSSEVEKNAIERQKYEQAIKDAQAKAEREQAVQTWRSGVASPVTGAQAASMPGGPTNANTEMIGQMPSPAALAARLQQGVLAGYITPEQARAALEMPDVVRPQVARTIETTDAQGRPVTVQFDKFGNRIGGELGQWKQPMQMGLGNRNTLVDPVTRKEVASFGIGQSPDSAASVAATIRGQNLTDAREREGMRQPKFNDGSWYYPPNMQNPGGIMVTPEGQNPPKGSKAAEQRNAEVVLSLLSDAEKIIPKSTGSYLGAGVDMATRAFGMSTTGAQNAAKLKTIEGALLAKMPRMEGPQSNYDVQNYKEAAAQLGDPTVPMETKLAAMQTLRTIQQRYAGGTPAQSALPGDVIPFSQLPAGR